MLGVLWKLTNLHCKIAKTLLHCKLQQSSSNVPHICSNGTRALLEGSKNFTVLIKNAIQFPYFGKQYSRRNVLEVTNKTYLQSCIYNKHSDPFCPVFRIGDIVKDAGENYSEVAIKVLLYDKIFNDTQQCNDN